MIRARLALAAACAIAVGLPLVQPASAAGTPRTANLKNANGGGEYTDAGGLDPVAIKTSGMKVAWKTKIDGQPYGQPIRVGGTVIAVTEENHVVAMSLASGKVAWDKTMGKPWSANNLTFKDGQFCPDLQPDIGITGTPVVDPSNQVIYFTSKQADPSNNRLAKLYLYAVRVSDGSTAWRTEIRGAADNVRGVVFNPTTANQRSGLTMVDGRVFFTTSSHCTIGPYRGFVIGVDVKSHNITAKWTSNNKVGTEKFTQGGNGIWMGGGPPTSDGSGRLFVSVGNGPPPAFNATSSSAYGMSVVRFKIGKTGRLTMDDFYTPALADRLNVNDSDLGTSPFVLLPKSFGTTTHPDIGVAVDKTTRVYIVDRDTMGKRTDPDSALQILGPYTYGSKQQTAIYSGDGGWFYIVDNTGVHAFTKVGTTITDSPLIEQEGVSGKEAHIGIAPAQGSVAVTSDGDRSGTGIVWVVGRDIPDKQPGHLLAFGAVPVNGKLPLLWKGPEYSGMKFARPLIADNHVIVGDYSGYLTAYVANSTTTGPNFVTSSMTFGRTPIGTSVTKEIDLLPRRGKGGGVRSMSSNNPQITLTRPHGDFIDVTYTPTTVGTLNTAFKVVTLGGPEYVTITAQGIPPGGSTVVAEPSSETFPPTVMTLTAQDQIELANDSDSPVTVASATTQAPFSVPAVVGVPVIPPHGKVGIPLTFTPTAHGGINGSLVITTSAGVVTVPMSGYGTRTGELQLNATAFTFPTTKVGKTTSIVLTLKNTGEGVLHFSKAKEPNAPFDDSRPLSEGTTIYPSYTLKQIVTFTPTKAGTFKSGYAIDVDDTQGGTRLISFTATATR